MPGLVQLQFRFWFYASPSFLLLAIIAGKRRCAIGSSHWELNIVRLAIRVDGIGFVVVGVIFPVSSS
jgi:hypothetical protein